MQTGRRNLSGGHLTTTRPNTRSKTLENGRENSLPIPIDLIMEIFSRLSIKSIAICRCVSKTWSSLLRRQDFTEMFLSRSCTLPKLLLAYKKGGELLFYSAPQLHVNSSATVVATYRMKMSFNAYFRNGVFDVSGLDHGLVGLTKQWISKNNKYSASAICNPSTGQLLPLTRRVKTECLVGYDPISKKVKVLSVSVSKVGDRPPNVVAEGYQVMTLGKGKLSTKMVNCDRLLYFYEHWKGRCINGVFYYQAFEKSTKTYMLVCFDVRSEKFSFIKVEKFLVSDGTMVNYNGKLGLLVSGDSRYVIERRSTSVSVWVLEDVEKQEWFEHTYVFPAMWKDIVGINVSVIVGMTWKNEIVMKSMLTDPPSPLYLIYFNIERNTVVKVGIQGMDVPQYGQVRIFLDHVDNVKYM